jgi:hypothetical protein
MAELVDGADGIAIGVSGLDLCVMVGRRNDRLPRVRCAAMRRRIRCDRRVARKVGVGHGLPAQIDRGLRAGIAGCGDGGQSQWGRRAEKYPEPRREWERRAHRRAPAFDLPRRCGRRAGRDTHRPGRSECFLSRVGRIVLAGVHKQALLDRLGRRREWALRGLGGGGVSSLRWRRMAMLVGSRAPAWSGVQRRAMPALRTWAARPITGPGASPARTPRHSTVRPSGRCGLSARQSR